MEKEIKGEGSQAPDDSKEENKDNVNKQDGSGEKQPEKEEKPDYKAELDRVEKELSKAQHKIVELKRDGKKSKEEDEDEKEDEGVDIEEIIESKISEVKSTLLADRVNELLDKESTSEDEKKLIKHYLDHKIKSSGNLVEDIKTAKFLANRNVIEKNMKAIKETLKEKDSFKGAGGSGSQGASDKPEIVLSDADRKIMKAFDVSEDDIASNY